MTITPLPTAVDLAVAVNREFLSAATTEVNDAFRKEFLKEVEWMRDYDPEDSTITIEFNGTSTSKLEPLEYFPEEFYRELRALGYRVTFERVDEELSSCSVALIAYE